MSPLPRLPTPLLPHWESTARTGLPSVQREAVRKPRKKNGERVAEAEAETELLLAFSDRVFVRRPSFVVRLDRRRVLVW